MIIKTDEIASVECVYPELMNSTASEDFKKALELQKSLMNELASARQNVRILEEKIKKHNEYITQLSPMFIIEYKIIDKEEINNKAPFAAFTPTDIRHSRCD